MECRNPKAMDGAGLCDNSSSSILILITSCALDPGIPCRDDASRHVNEIFSAAAAASGASTSASTSHAPSHNSGAAYGRPLCAALQAPAPKISAGTINGSTN